MAEAVSSSRDCLQAGESCTNDPICSAKFRTLRQCIAGNGANKLGPDAKSQCRSTVTALLSSQLYGCKCKRGMKKEKHCLSVYWSIHHTLMEGQSSRVLLSDGLPKRQLLLGLSAELPSTKVAAIVTPVASRSPSRPTDPHSNDILGKVILKTGATSFVFCNLAYFSDIPSIS